MHYISSIDYIVSLSDSSFVKDSVTRKLLRQVHDWMCSLFCFPLIYVKSDLYKN